MNKLLIKELKQENKMLRRIIVNLKRELKESRKTHKHHTKWSQELKNTIIQLRDIEKKDFAEITSILNLNQKEARILYKCALHGRAKK